MRIPVRPPSLTIADSPKSNSSGQRRHRLTCLAGRVVVNGPGFALRRKVEEPIFVSPETTVEHREASVAPGLLRHRLLTARQLRVTPNTPAVAPSAYSNGVENARSGQSRRQKQYSRRQRPCPLRAAPTKENVAAHTAHAHGEQRSGTLRYHRPSRTRRFCRPFRGNPLGHHGVERARYDVRDPLQAPQCSRRLHGPSIDGATDCGRFAKLLRNGGGMGIDSSGMEDKSDILLFLYACAYLSCGLIIPSPLPLLPLRFVFIPMGNLGNGGDRVLLDAVPDDFCRSR